MYRKILVPLDGSKHAEAILPHVKELASCLDAAVVLMQVVEPAIIYASPYDSYPELTLEEVNERGEAVDQYLAGIEAEFTERHIQVDRRVEYGPVVMTIIDVAAREEADLVAMTSQGRSGLARVFYGSVAAGVLQRIDRPLLLVRSP